ncbi:MAG TPA: hypothetical protein VGO04_09465 [Ensifer sp.]|jgi:hypothetical protein|uniref:hypothetical protein n=1 Tax=Ensifer sp. TaxID=1872086 RepID=UPI002E13986E|nr:hypothetical protein [Ensifer sp.]
MAVIIEAISVVLNGDALKSKYLGGVENFLKSLPNDSIRGDGDLVALTFTSPQAVQKYVTELESAGLIYKLEERSIDICVVDQRDGILVACSWAQFGHLFWNNDAQKKVAVCVSDPNIAQRIVVPAGWSFEESLTAKSIYMEQIPENLKKIRENITEDVYVDKNTGQEFYLKK